jgi:sugar lactone lactonase YvrE/DNA-binding IclR family transcriptional regulator
MAIKGTSSVTADGPPEGRGVSGVGVLEKAMGLLALVAAARRPTGFTELLRASGLPKATLHRMLSTLLTERLLHHNGEAKTYQLGLRFLELAHQVWGDFDLRVAAQDELLRLRDQTEETVQLAILNGHDVVVVASETPRTGIRLASSTGQRLPLHGSALGKAMAAMLDAGSQRALLERTQLHALTPHTLTSMSALQNNLDLTHTRGYSLENQEFAEGLQGIAAPILNFEGRPIGAVGLSGPSFRLSVEKAHALAPLVIGSARRISHNAGGSTMSVSSPPRPTAAAFATSAEAECVSEARALLGEAPLWRADENALYWVDIVKPSVHRYDPATGVDREIAVPAMVSAAVPMAGGGLLLATPGGLMSFDLATERLTRFVHPESERPGNRYNDAKCDRLGRLWVGSMDMGAAPNRGNLFRVDPDGSVQRMDGGFTVANGLGWSPDNRRMYFTDTFRRTVYEYDFNLRQGSISNRRALIEFPEGGGVPDGLTVDEEGCLWIALWDGWAIERYSPAGESLQRVRVPVPRPTSCGFGGARLDALYITSATVRVSAETLHDAPLSGGLFMYRPGVRGLPETAFGG